MYYLLFGFLYLLSLLPLRVLYLLSDVAYVVVYYLLGYRKAVVHHNLTIAFPQKNRSGENQDCQTVLQELLRHLYRNREIYKCQSALF